MKSNYFKLILQTDLVITANSATQGEHEALDFIPGSLLRGAVINNLGGDFQPELFFSGKIRFHNAYPMTQDNNIALPIPFSYHNPKGNPETIYNKVFDYSEKGQPEQLRGNYMYDNKKIVVDTTYRMKTAISRDEGYTAKESQLFGYQSIKAGNIYGCSIDFDDDISNEIIEKITNCLIENNIRLGKSRSAEYGLVKAELINNIKNYSSGTPPKDTTLLYLASDLYLEENGIPVTRLKAKHFGLDSNIQIDWEHSFVRIRKYSPWNSFWKGRMRERQVIRRGSVITLKKQLDTEELKKRFEKGYGLFREEGLGKILVNPGFLCKDKIDLQKYENSSSDIQVLGLVNESLSDKALIDILRNRSSAQSDSLRSKEIGKKWANSWYEHWYDGKFDIELLPKKTQWRQILDIFSNFEGTNQTIEETFNNYCSNNERQRIWRNQETELNINNHRYKILDYIQQIIIAENNPNLAVKALCVAAKEISCRIE